MADPNPAPPAFPFERCVYPPWAHQRTGTERLVADPRGVLLADPEGRVCRPGQTEKVRTYNMVALGSGAKVVQVTVEQPDGRFAA